MYVKLKKNTNLKTVQKKKIKLNFNIQNHIEFLFIIYKYIIKK